MSDSLQTRDLIREFTRRQEESKAITNSGYDRPHYWSGIDASLYVKVGENLLLLPTSVSIEVLVQESHIPLYGIGSREFAAITEGHVSITGSLRMAFLYNGYLYDIINKAMKSTEKEYDSIDGYTSYDILVGRYSANHTKQIVEDNMKTYRERLWNNTWTDIPNSSEWSTGITKDESVGTNGNRQRIDFIVKFGDNISGDGNYTIKVLQDIYITSMHTMAEPSGVPIFETYSFIARSDG